MTPRPLERTTVLVLAFAAVTIASGCPKRIKTEHYRFGLEADCQAHCEAQGKLGRVDWADRECVCGVAE